MIFLFPGISYLQNFLIDYEQADYDPEDIEIDYNELTVEVAVINDHIQEMADEWGATEN